MNKPIYFLSKTNQWYELSNFYLFGFMDEESLYWPTVEHYFQSMKFPGENYREYREKISSCSNTRKSKKTRANQTNTFKKRLGNSERRSDVICFNKKI